MHTRVVDHTACGDVMGRWVTTGLVGILGSPTRSLEAKIGWANSRSKSGTAYCEQVRAIVRSFRRQSVSTGNLLSKENGDFIYSNMR